MSYVSMYVRVECRIVSSEDIKFGCAAGSYQDHCLFTDNKAFMSTGSEEPPKVRTLQHGITIHTHPRLTLKGRVTNNIYSTT